jgi:hypothetical protein
MAQWKLPVHKITSFFLAFTYIYANNYLYISIWNKSNCCWLTSCQRTSFATSLTKISYFMKIFSTTLATVSAFYTIAHHLERHFFLHLTLIFFMSQLTDVLHLGICILFFMSIRILTRVVHSFNEDKNHELFLVTYLSKWTRFSLLKTMWQYSKGSV